MPIEEDRREVLADEAADERSTTAGIGDENEPFSTVLTERWEAVVDPDFYLSTYRDVAAAGVDPRSHYALNGRAERRYASEAQLRADMLALDASGLLDNAYLTGALDGRSTRELLLDLSMSGELPFARFDPEFVRRYYHRTLVDGESLLGFFARHGHRSWAFASYEDAAAAASAFSSDDLFNADYVRSQTGLPEDLNPAVYFLTEGARMGVDPSSSFSTTRYLLQYRDIAQSQMNPLLHYLKHGRAEGRVCLPRRSSGAQRGGRDRKPGLRTVLICSHEASRSGAPLVALNLARHLAGDWNVVTLLLRGGELADEFSSVSVGTIIAGDHPSSLHGVVQKLKDDGDIDAAITNSIVTSRILPILGFFEIPTVALIHEYAQYVWPFDQMAQTIALCDRVVFPAAAVRDAANRELAQLGVTASLPCNTVVRAQGRSLLPPVENGEPARLPRSLQRRRGDDGIIVVGAGWVQPRKGVDLFIEAARILRHEMGVDCTFVWVGPNYDPRKDMLVSVYLEDQIRASDLEDVVFFEGEMTNLSAVWGAADVFFMSSRLDPYPNVALDALAERLPVVCFEKATGIADLSRDWGDRVKAVAYNDVHAAASAIAAFGRRGDSGELPEKLKDILSFDRYAGDIAAWLEEAIRSQDDVRSLADELDADPLYDPLITAADLPDWAPSAEYRPDRMMLARLCARAAKNGIALARRDRTRLTMLDGAGRWSQRALPVIAPGPRRAAMPFVALLRTERREDVQALARLAFSRALVSRLTVVSETLEERDLDALRGLGTAHPPRRVQRMAEVFGEPDDVPMLLLDAKVPDSRDEFTTLSGLVADQSLGMLLTWCGAKQAPPVLDASTRHGTFERLPDRRLIDARQLWLAPTGRLAARLFEAWGERRTTSLWDAIQVVTDEFDDWAIADVSDRVGDYRYKLLFGREPILATPTR